MADPADQVRLVVYPLPTRAHYTPAEITYAKALCVALGRGDLYIVKPRRAD